jgi:hypothetical protein
MGHSTEIPDLDGTIESIDKCNKLQTLLFPASDGVTTLIPENFVVSQRDLSNIFVPGSRSGV